MGRGHAAPAGWTLQRTVQNKGKEHQKGFKGKQQNDGACVYSSPSCKVSLNLHKTGHLRTWEMVSVLKTRWWIRWKPQGAHGRVGEGRMCQHKEQPKWWRRITSCSVSLNHHYMLTPIPRDISFHATHSNRIFMVWIYLNPLFSLFSRLSNTALSGPVFYILNFTRLTVFLCGSKPIWSI